MINFGANIRQNVIKIRKFRSDSMQIESDFKIITYKIMDYKIFYIYS